MATGENIEEPQKDKAADPEEHIQDKGVEIKDIKNVGEACESVKNNEAVIIEEVVVEDKKKKNEAETNEIVVEDKRQEADQTEKKKDDVEKPDASESTNVEKSPSMAPGEKLEEAQKDKGAVGEVEEKKKIEAEPREIAVDEKMKEAEKEVGLEVKKENGEVEIGGASESGGVEKCSSLREERNFLSDLKEHEKRALMELRSKIEKAILENKFLKENKDQIVENAVKAEQIEEKESGEVKKTMQNEGKGEENVLKEMEKEKETSKKVNEIDEMEEKKMENIEKGEENVVKEIEKEKEASKEVEEVEAAQPNKQQQEEKNKKAEECQKETNKDVTKVDANINKDIAIWGVPLLPSKGDNATDVILLKFLRAREFEVYDAFEMLRNTLQWRKDKNIDSILDENFGDDLGSMSSMVGVSRSGHMVCYSFFKLLGDEELYNKVLGTEEKREMFVRSRVQLMERAIQKLDFKPGGVSSILLVNDLKEMPGPSRKELRNATKQVLALLQDNYPEFVARNIFINVPFWYYAFSASALLSPFLTPRTNSKFVFARPSRVTEVLLKYIASEELPVHYGGLRKENDTDFSTEDVVSVIFVNQSSTECIQIPAPEAGLTLMWEVIVLGWEVNYKEEFIPTEEGSYGIIVQRGRRIGVQEGSIRNSFTNNEPGNIVLTIENGALIKKKRICYRYKIKNRSSSGKIDGTC